MSDLPNKSLLRPDEVAKHYSVSVKTVRGRIGSDGHARGSRATAINVQNKALQRRWYSRVGTPRQGRTYILEIINHFHFIATTSQN